MDVQQLRARVAQLESAIDKARIEGAAATAQLEKEEDEGVLVTLWARITARKNAGKTLEQQLAAARAELAEAEQVAAMVGYRAAQKTYEATVAELKKSAAVTMAKAEAAAAALDALAVAHRGTGAKFTGHSAAKHGVDPDVLYVEAAGLLVRGGWRDGLQAYRPEHVSPGWMPSLLEMGVGGK